MFRISSVVACLLIVGCSSSAPAANAGGADVSADIAADVSATKDSTMAADTATTDSTTPLDVAIAPDIATVADVAVDPSAGCSADGTPFTHTISIKKDGVAVDIPTTAKRFCKPSDKELDVDFGDQSSPLPEGKLKFRISLLGAAKQPTEDGFTLADASFTQFILYQGGPTAMPTFTGKAGTPTTQSLTISGGKLTFAYKGNWGDPKAPYVIEIDIKDAPIK